MATMEITTVIGCTVYCSFCPQTTLIKSYRKSSQDTVMRLDAYRTCLEKIPPHVDIHFSGMSEPWLNEHCTQMILDAHERGHKIAVYSTLVGMRPEDVAAIEHIPFKIFDVHLPAEEGLEQITVDESYQNVVKTLLLSKMDAFYHTLSGNLHHKLETIMREMNLRSWPLITRAGNKKIEGVNVPPRKEGRIRCSRSIYQNVMHPNGDVVLCCMDYGRKHIIGNLLHMDYHDLFKGREFSKIKQGMIDDGVDSLCRTCEVSVSVDQKQEAVDVGV